MGAPCPKCIKPMSLWRSGDIELDHCRVCKGLWFDANELVRHLANIGGDAPVEAPVAGDETNLSCPRCDGARLRQATLLGVTVECCPLCSGAFLELGELHEILGALHPPARASNPASSLSGMDPYALGLFVGMRRHPPA